MTGNCCTSEESIGSGLIWRFDDSSRKLEEKLEFTEDPWVESRENIDSRLLEALAWVRLSFKQGGGLEGKVW